MKKRKEHKLHGSALAKRHLAQLAVHLKGFRRASGKTQRDLAEMVGCSAQQVRNVELEANYPSLPVYLAMAEVTGWGRWLPRGKCDGSSGP